MFYLALINLILCFFSNKQKLMLDPSKKKMKTRYLFAVVDDPDAVCRDGAHVGMMTSQTSVLGQSDMGVYMFQHTDLCLASLDVMCNTMKLVVFKVSSYF